MVTDEIVHKLQHAMVEKFPGQLVVFEDDPCKYNMEVDPDILLDGHFDLRELIELVQEVTK